MNVGASARGFWLTLVGSALGYPVIVLVPFAVTEPDDKRVWPVILAFTAGVATCGIVLSTRTRWRKIGLGLMLGVALGVIIAVVVLVIALNSLADEIGYS